MAGMGTTGTVNITPEMMDAAVKAISEYRSSTQALYKSVDTEVNNLTAKDFTGSASTGFVTFYTNNIEPVTGKSLTDILDTLESICNSIKSAIPDTEGVDEQLGAANGKN
jgi:uncharacterized protein YukE